VAALSAGRTPSARSLACRGHDRGVPDQSPSVSLGQLLALGLLPGHELLGGAAGLSRPLTAVMPGTSPRRVGDLRPGTVAVFELSQFDATDVTTDYAIRLGHSAGLAGLILQRPRGTVPLATRRLADQFEVPVLLLDSVDAGALVAALDPYVRGPEVVGANMITQAVHRLRVASRNPDEVVAVLAATIDNPVGVVDSEGRLVTGDPLVCDALHAGDLIGQLQLSEPASSSVEVQGEFRLLLQPLRLTDSGPANLWLVARLPREASSLTEPAREALGIGAWAFTSYLATQSLEVERQSRQRALLLTEILDHADAPPRRTVERATAAGWRLSGWHTAVHIAVSQHAGRARPSDLAQRIEDALNQHRVKANLIERPDGWAFWTTSDAEPEARQGTELARNVRRAMLQEERERLRLRLCAGIGRPYQGTSGLQLSLHEAHQACLLAGTQDVAGAVEHIDAMNLKRLLVGWYASGPLREVAAELLQPLWTADPTGDLVRTLGCYLDHESSATTTALVLGVHRNTVLHRLDRIRGLLAADLNRPDERLVAHLATRVAGIEDHGEFGVDPL
jgi:purine catabolism regulator